MYNYKKKIKYILSLIIFLILFISFNFKNKSKKNLVSLKVALCTMGKKENLYVNEYINYYIQLGIDHIFIYDDNDPGNEKISDVIDRSYGKYVTIYENISQTIKNQPTAFTACYKNNYKKFDWILMFDMDEFLFIVNDTLKNYLKKDYLKKCDFIRIHWVIPTDNNLLHYDNRSLFKRFKRPYLESTLFKTLVRGNIDDLKYDIHSFDSSPKRNLSCNNIGKIVTNNIRKYFSDKAFINIEKAYIIHFKFKSTEEFINKFKRGYRKWFRPDFMNRSIKDYLKYNKLTYEKIKYFERELNLNLTSYNISKFKR